MSCQIHVTINANFYIIELNHFWLPFYNYQFSARVSRATLKLSVMQSLDVFKGLAECCRKFLLAAIKFRLHYKKNDMPALRFQGNIFNI